MDINIRSPVVIYQNMVANLEKVITGQTNAIRKLLAAFASGGHILLEDLPGTGKTTLAKALAQSLQLHFQRIQFTPDLFVRLFTQHRTENNRIYVYGLFGWRFTPSSLFPLA